MDAVKNFDVQSVVVDTVTRVFQTMLAMDLEFMESMTQSYLYGSRILGSINLVGRALGIVNIQVGSDFSQVMTRAMLDLEDGETADPAEVKDVVGEVCNMISGGIKSALCDAGLDCELSPPSLTSGKDYHLESSPMSRHDFFSFYRGDDLLLVDVGLKEPDPDALDEPAVPERGDHGLNDQVMDFDVAGSVSPSVVEVFDMMLDMAVSPEGVEQTSGAGGRIVASISLSGKVRGRVNMVVSEPFSRQMTAAMLDMDEDEIEGMEEIRDIIGEVCNMISGTLKSDLCDAGLACRLSPPSFTSGTDFEMESLYLTRQERLAFHQGDNLIVIEVGLGASDAAA
jgi:chemotaxis protein CheX